MILTLQLRHQAPPQRAADAWFINGNEPARWLDELARSGLAQTETRLFVISASNQSRITHPASRIAGLLVVPGTNSAPSAAPAAPPRKSAPSRSRMCRLPRANLATTQFQKHTAGSNAPSPKD